MSSLLAALRAHTASQHAALDAAFPDHPTRAYYVGFLRAHLAIARALEPRLARWQPDSVVPSRTERLVADLAALGAMAPVPAVEVDVAATRAAMLGVAYVVEGSTLGGMVLAERFEADPELSGATSFLRLRGKHSAAHWRRFIDQLEHAELDDDERDDACAAAAATFALYARELGMVRS